MDTINKIDSQFVKEKVLRYINEVIEAFLALTIFRLLAGQNANLFTNLKISAFIGILTLILEEYNPMYKTSLKNGALVSMISRLLKMNI